MKTLSYAVGEENARELKGILRDLTEIPYIVENQADLDLLFGGGGAKMSREIGFRAYIKPLKRYATDIDTIQFHKCCDVAGAGIWSVVTANEGYSSLMTLLLNKTQGLKIRTAKRFTRENTIVG